MDDSSDADPIEALLRAELVQSERLRALVAFCLVATFTAVVLGLKVAGLIAPEMYVHVGPLSLLSWILIAQAALLSGEAFVWFYLRDRRSVPEVMRWLITPAEAVYGSTILLVFTATIDPAYGLHAPPTLFFGVVLVLSALHLNAAISLFSGAFAASCYLAVAAWALHGYQGPAEGTFLVAAPAHVIRGAFIFLTGAGTGFVTQEILRRATSAFDASRQREHVLNLLAQQVSRQVATRLMEDGGEGRTETMCVMFLDIRDFTATAEQQTPRETVRWLNLLFDDMIAVVNRHGGVVNKFLGDGFMALFGVPFTEGNPSAAATRAALEIADQLADSPTRVGIGLHTGEVLVGNVGSGTRREYTVIGDTVNLASRVEQLNKQLDAAVLLTAATWEHAAVDTSILRRVDGVSVKGRAEPVTIIQLR